MDQDNPDALRKERKATNQRAYYSRNRVSECEKALERAYNTNISHSAMEARRLRHNEAQARYRKRLASRKQSDTTTQGVKKDITADDIRKQKHRESQARYRERNKEGIQMRRWLKTKAGFQYKLSLLAPVEEEDLAAEHVDE